MQKRLNNQSGFTLIEMMIVLLVISVLILLAIPNVTKRAAEIDETGCEALEQIREIKSNHPETQSYQGFI